MTSKLGVAIATVALVIAITSGGSTALAQKPGGILRTYDPDSPGGMSIQEEANSASRVDQHAASCRQEPTRERGQQEEFGINPMH